MDDAFATSASYRGAFVCLYACPLCIPTSLHTSHHPFQFSPPPFSFFFSLSLSLSLSRYLRIVVLCQRTPHSESAAYPFCKPLTAFQRENEHFWLGAAKEYTANPKATLTADVLWNTQAPGESNPQATSNPVHFPYNAHTEQAAASASSLSAADAQLVAERRTWKGKHGFVWWHAHVNWFLHKDSPRRASLDEYVASLKLRPSCIAVHIRRGDSCHDETKAYRKVRRGGGGWGAGALSLYCSQRISTVHSSNFILLPSLSLSLSYPSRSATRCRNTSTPSAQFLRSTTPPSITKSKKSNSFSLQLMNLPS